MHSNIAPLVVQGRRSASSAPDITAIMIGASTPEELEESVATAEAGALPLGFHQAVEVGSDEFIPHDRLWVRPVK